MKSFKQTITEAHKSKILREDVWTDYYMKIADIDFNPKTYTSKYNTRKELEAALKKAYGWDVKRPAIKDAIDRYFETEMKESAVCKVKGKKITESKKVGDNSIDFENVAGGLQFSLGWDGLRVQSYSGGNGFDKEWKNEEYKKLKSENKWDEITKLCDKVVKDLLPVCDRFDKELESVMKKYGFKK